MTFPQRHPEHPAPLAPPVVASAPAQDTHRPSSIDTRLVEGFQRDFPLVSRPFAAIGKVLGADERTVIERLSALEASGIVARVGGVVRPNTLGASTLAALAAPELRIEEVAGVLAGFAGINHIYLRENDWNLWFVVTGPDRAYVESTLERVGRLTGLKVLDLRLEEAYHIDLGFDLGDRPRRRYHNAGSASPAVVADCDAIDRALAQILTDGLPLVERPFAAVADGLGLDEREVLRRLEALVASAVVPRVGVIVRHRALGWRSNAMVVWDVPADNIDEAGRRLADVPGINLCYRRTRYERDWPYDLYCMVHARSREEALETIAEATVVAGLESLPRQILFSLRCFKQTGALLSLKEAH